MPAPAVKTLAKKAGWSVAKAERAWNKIKQAVVGQTLRSGTTIGDNPDAWTSEIWAYVMGSLKGAMKVEHVNAEQLIEASLKDDGLLPADILRNMIYGGDRGFGHTMVPGSARLREDLTEATYRVEVYDKANDDKQVQSVRVDSASGFAMYVKKYKASRYTVQLMKDNKIVKDNGGIGGKVRTFKEDVDEDEKVVRVYFPNRAKVVKVAFNAETRRIFNQLKKDGDTWIAGTKSSQDALRKHVVEDVGGDVAVAVNPGADTDSDIVAELQPNEMALYVETPEEKAEYKELLHALDAAQVRYKVENIDETGETIVSWNEVDSKAVESTLSGLGIGLTFDDDDPEATFDYHEDAESLIDRALAGDENVFEAKSEADMLSRGFDAGNYAEAYNGRIGLWGNLRKQKERGNAAFKAAFIIGYYGSYEDHEIPGSDLDEYLSAKASYGSKMKRQGIAVEGIDEKSSQYYDQRNPNAPKGPAVPGQRKNGVDETWGVGPQQDYQRQQYDRNMRDPPKPAKDSHSDLEDLVMRAKAFVANG